MLLAQHLSCGNRGWCRTMRSLNVGKHKCYKFELINIGKILQMLNYDQSKIAANLGKSDLFPNSTLT